MRKCTEIREKNRTSPLFNHLSAISEGVPALGWVAVVRRTGGAAQLFWLKSIDLGTKTSAFCRRYERCSTVLHQSSFERFQGKVNSIVTCCLGYISRTHITPNQGESSCRLGERIFYLAAWAAGVCEKASHYRARMERCRRNCCQRHIPASLTCDCYCCYCNSTQFAGKTLYGSFIRRIKQGRWYNIRFVIPSSAR